MEYRQLGGSGLYVPVLCLGTATFGGTNGFEGWGHTQVEEARRMINKCLDRKKYWARRWKACGINYLSPQRQHSI